MAHNTAESTNESATAIHGLTCCQRTTFLKAFPNISLKGKHPVPTITPTMEVFLSEYRRATRWIVTLVMPYSSGANRTATAKPDITGKISASPPDQIGWIQLKVLATTK